MSHYLLQQSLLDTKTIQNIEHLACQEANLSRFDLMYRAGRSVWDELTENFAPLMQLHIFCGSGNNGGDGYVVAHLAAQADIAVQVYELGDKSKMSQQTQQARALCIDAKVNCQPFHSICPLVEGVIVDGLIGNGFDGVMRDDYAEAIECINSSLLPVLSIDMPSGVLASTGAINDIAVKADVTVTFIAAKPGLFTGRGPALCGELVYDSLDIHESILHQALVSARLMSLEDLIDYMPQVEADVHKNQRGHCMVIGGDLGTGGASILASQGCLTLGAGLTTLATRPEHVSPCLVRQPEIMACGIVSGQELEPLLDKPNVLVLGPGLGMSSWSEQLLQKAMSTNLPMVVDADALNIIAQGRVVKDVTSRSWVFTPHPGEAARLLGISVSEVEQDRFGAVRKLQEKYNAVVVLKGAGTLVSGGLSQPTNICPYGNPAMATAGMGDILSGVIGGLIAQGVDVQTAAELGCCLHSAAADMAADEMGSKCLVAGDILPFLKALLNDELS
ncbi:MAG: NAD(P)H-hydrate dehydratase [Porticoccaceae bacterium]|nr:NAD(P)H-hydrate dehydratase [Porticoccaceae bacterium]